MDAHDQRTWQQESRATADCWGSKSLISKDQNRWITTKQSSRASSFIRSCMTSRLHRLKKTSSMQLKRRDLITGDYIVRQTKKLSFYCYSPQWITTTFSTKLSEENFPKGTKKTVQTLLKLETGPLNPGSSMLTTDLSMLTSLRVNMPMHLNTGYNLQSKKTRASIWNSSRAQMSVWIIPYILTRSFGILKLQRVRQQFFCNWKKFHTHESLDIDKSIFQHRLHCNCHTQIVFVNNTCSSLTW